MSTWILMTVIGIWAMMFYLGFKLIDIRHDLRMVRLHMQRVSRSRIRR